MIVVILYLVNSGLCVIVGALLLRVWVTARAGKMPWTATAGTLLIYAGIMVNHLLFMWDKIFWPGSVLITFGLLGSLHSLLTLMKVRLFRR